MKNLPLINFVIFFTTSVNLTHASELRLENGVYATQNQDSVGKSYCEVIVENELSTGDLIMQECNSSFFTMKRKSGTQYTQHAEHVITSEMVATCTPRDSNKKPCYDWLYASDTGALLIKAGDTYQGSQDITILNPRAFKFHPAVIRVKRDATVVINISPKENSETALYTKQR